MWCSNCSKKYDETGHVCYVPRQALIEIPLAKIELHRNYSHMKCDFCTQSARERIGKLNACKDHAEDALYYRDLQQERGE